MKENKKDTNLKIGILLCIVACIGIICAIKYFARQPKSTNSSTQNRSGIEVLYLLGACKIDEKESSLVKSLKEEKGLDVSAKEIPLLHTVKVQDGVEVYDAMLELCLLNYKNFFPDLAECYPELLTMKETDILELVNNGKELKLDKKEETKNPLNYLYMCCSFDGDIYFKKYVKECLDVYDAYSLENGSSFHDKSKEQLTVEDYVALAEYAGKHMDAEKYPILYKYFYGGRQLEEKENYREMIKYFDLSAEADQKLETILEDIDTQDYSHYQRNGKYLINTKVWEDVKELVAQYGDAVSIREDMKLEEFLDGVKTIDSANSLNLSSDLFDESQNPKEWIQTLSKQCEETHFVMAFSVENKNEDYMMILSNDAYQAMQEVAMRISGDGFYFGVSTSSN